MNNMKDWTVIRERYLRDPLPVRLGGLAANLSRMKSFSANDASRETVASLIDESKMFIELTAAQTEIPTAEKLVELQVQLARWQLAWDRIWSDAIRRKQFADQSADWSKQVLELSGLLNRQSLSDAAEVARLGAEHASLRSEMIRN